MRDESYGQIGESEVYKGKFAMVYSKSVFLDFVGQGTWASERHPGPFVHYGFWTLNHLVDVAACKPPEIQRSTVEAARGQYRHANWQRTYKEPSK